jgi:hypothetical protein
VNERRWIDNPAPERGDFARKCVKYENQSRGLITEVLASSA